MCTKVVTQDYNLFTVRGCLAPQTPAETLIKPNLPVPWGIFKFGSIPPQNRTLFLQRNGDDDIAR